MNQKFLATSIATILIASMFIFVPIKPAYAATFAIDANGGDCNANNTATPIGVWDARKHKCTLKFDLIGSIEITGAGITLDGARHTLTGDGTLGSIGVLVGAQTGVTIKNVIVTNFDIGIYIFNSDSNTLTGNTANSNVLFGISLSESNGNILTSNTANSNGVGIFIEDSNGNTLTSNTANSNSDHGIRLSFSNSNTLTGNTANSNSDHGIDLDESHGNTLSSNTANSNSNDGINLDDADNSVLQKNTASLNIGNGFRLFSSDNISLKGNTANSNAEFGFESGVIGLAFSKNKCSGNGSGGSSPTGLCSPQP